MQAIITKYLGPTNSRGSRIKATCERGSVTISYMHDVGREHAHAMAAWALVEKFAKEDAHDGHPAGISPWSGQYVCGGLPGGGCVFVRSFLSSSYTFEPGKITRHEEA